MYIHDETCRIYFGTNILLSRKSIYSFTSFRMKINYNRQYFVLSIQLQVFKLSPTQRHSTSALLYKYKDSSRSIFASTFFSETIKKMQHIILVIRQEKNIPLLRFE
jgi:hypothetical protein